MLTHSTSIKQSKVQKKSRYTHKVSYSTNQGNVASFRTPQDMLQFHLSEMKRGALCFDIKVELL